MRDVTVAGPGRARRMTTVWPGGRAGPEATFTVDDLSALRRLATEHGRRAGMDPGKVGDFVLAVNEAATNAICHGGSRASLRLWQSGEDLCCEVRGGSWIPSDQPLAVPDEADRLRLWVVWQVCTDVDLSYGPDTTTVRLSMRAR
jgi:serine/threonine-protein kinase RsbW